MAATTTTSTHEQFIGRVRDYVVANSATLTEDEKSKLAHTRLMYGVGQAGVRGVCYFESWQNGVGKVDVIEVSAQTQENWVQLTGTTVHELAHVLAGHAAGHGPEWKEAAVRLGFSKKPEAAGQRYVLALFRGSLREFALGRGHAGRRGHAGLPDLGVVGHPRRAQDHPPVFSRQGQQGRHLV